MSIWKEKMSDEGLFKQIDSQILHFETTIENVDVAVQKIGIGDSRVYTTKRLSEILKFAVDKVKERRNNQAGNLDAYMQIPVLIEVCNEIANSINSILTVILDHDPQKRGGPTP